MPPPSSQKIFVSYAHADAAELAQRLVHDLKDAGLEPWLDVQRLNAGANWTTNIEDELDQADIVIALLTRGSDRSEIYRAEQLRAPRTGKCVIPLLAQPGANIPLHLEPKHYLSFTATNTYQHLFAELLRSIGAREGAVLLLENILDLMRSGDLAGIQAQFPNYSHPNLFLAIQVSVDQLDAKLCDRYLSLAVLLEDMVAELPVLRGVAARNAFDVVFMQVLRWFDFSSSVVRASQDREGVGGIVSFASSVSAFRRNRHDRRRRRALRN